MIAAPIRVADARELTIAQIADQALAAWQAAASPSVELAIAAIDTADGQIAGVVWISIGQWDAALSPAGARRLGREITASWDWAQALPYDPDALAGHLVTMAIHAEHMNSGR